MPSNVANISAPTTSTTPFLRNSGRDQIDSQSEVRPAKGRPKVCLDYYQRHAKYVKRPLSAMTICPLTGQYPEDD